MRPLDFGNNHYSVLKKGNITHHSSKSKMYTGKSLSEVHIFASTK